MQIISVVGAGGKTTFLKETSFKVYEKYNVLVSTTTKMKMPDLNDYTSLIVKKSDFEKYEDYFLKNNKLSEYQTWDDHIILNNSGIEASGNIYYYLPDIDMQREKFMHISDDYVRFFSRYFNYILLESDGARKKSLKFPKENEPVISKYTTHTIAVLDISTVGMKINEENIYNVEGFCKNLGVSIGDKVSVDILVRLVKHENGLFKKAVGKKTLLINKVDDEYYKYAEEIKNRVDVATIFQLKIGYEEQKNGLQLNKTNN